MILQARPGRRVARKGKLACPSPTESGEVAMPSQGRIHTMLGSLLALGALLVTAACGGSDQPEAPAAPAGDPAFPRTVTHAMGTTEIPAPPQRVLALDTTLSGPVLLRATELVGSPPLEAADEPLPGYLGADAERFGA